MLRIGFTIIGALLAVVSSSVSCADFTTAVPLLQKSAGTYYVAADFEGRARDEFMVDTGCGHVAINEHTLAVLQEIGAAEYLKEVAGVLADGSTRQVPVYRISSMRVGECVIGDVEAVLFPGATRQILGLSALNKMAPFAISVEPPRLLLTNCQGGPSAPHAAAER